MKRSRLWFTALLIALPLAVGITGDKEGNGGDHVRATFIRAGHAILKHLEETQQGVDIVKEYHLNIDDLNGTLTVQKITVVEGALKDNGGSDVDAVGVPGSITLKKEAWIDHFERERDVYYLIFHEMLRSAGVNDDNYVISRAIRPFPASAKVLTKIVTLLPLIGGDLLADVIDPEKIEHAGTGCEIDYSDATLIDFDTEKNILDVTFKQFKAMAGLGMPSSAGREACTLIIPFTAPIGKRLHVSQIDLHGKVKLPSGTRAKLYLGTYVQGGVGPVNEKHLFAVGDDMHGRVLMRVNDAFSTPCGAPRALQIKSSASTSSRLERLSEISVDRISLYFKVEDCRR